MIHYAKTQNQTICYCIDSQSHIPSFPFHHLDNLRVSLLYSQQSTTRSQNMYQPPANIPSHQARHCVNLEMSTTTNTNGTAPICGPCIRTRPSSSDTPEAGTLQVSNVKFRVSAAPGMPQPMLNDALHKECEKIKHVFGNELETQAEEIARSHGVQLCEAFDTQLV